MANEGIRLPSDSTVASQKVHRGSDLPETQISQTTSKEIPKPTPLLTVVLQARTLIAGKKGSLFELVLQNDPKSNPPVIVQSDSLIKPGTSLLLELDINQQYRPVEKPTNEQLLKLINLELEFWRAHLLPKAGHRVFPNPPTPSALTELIQQYPSLKPVADWMSQWTETLSSRTVQRWFAEMSPLNTWRPQTIPVSSKTHFPFLKEAPNSNPLMSTQGAGISANRDRHLDRPLLITDTRLTLKTGELLSSPAQTSIVSILKGLSAATNSYSTMSSTRVPNGQSTSKTSTDSVVRLQFTEQLFRLVNAEAKPSAMQLHQAITPQRPGLDNPQSQTYTAVPNPTYTGSTRNPISFVTLNWQARTESLQPVSLASYTATEVQTSEQSMPKPVAAGFTTTNTTGTRFEAVGGAAVSQPTPSSNPYKTHQVLAAPVSSPQPSSTLPLEVTLGLWIQEIDRFIAASPPELQAQLKSKAAALLAEANHQELKVQNRDLADGLGKPQDRDEPSVLALRNWLEATQARLQHTAVVTASAQWANPDQPVQQIQLPLIWLGLTHWADIEWWQEKSKAKNSKEKNKEKDRQWRMKIFLTLEPLQALCADIHWSKESTQVTFWSQDAATLNHLNQLLPTLASWTSGLGDSTVTTKHGMPQRTAQASTPVKEQHLVDIRT